METLLAWELDFILGLRELVPGLVRLAEGATFLGNELFFLMLLPLVYWAFDRRTGAQLTLLFLLSSYVSVTAKWLVGQPRPFELAPDRVEAGMGIPLEEAMERYEATSESFPSGHSQNAVTVWGFLASQLGHTWARIAAVVLILLVSFSRVYLLVHFPHDLLGGYFFGALVLFAYLWLSPHVETWLEDRRLGWQIAIAVGVPILMFLTTPIEGSFTAGGTLLGAGVGLALERRWIRFEGVDIWWKGVLRYLVGMIVLVGLYAGLKAAFSSLEPAWLFRVIRYTLMGFWVAAGAPFLFTKVGLAATR